MDDLVTMVMRGHGMAGSGRNWRTAVIGGLFAFAVALAGAPASAVVPSAGQLYAFGHNDAGQLGRAANLGTDKPNDIPAQVALPEDSAVVQATAGAKHSLALTSSGRLYAFGGNLYGQLGSPTNSGTNIPNQTPSLVSFPWGSGTVAQVAAGSHHTLSLTSSGQLYAFGANDFGQLGSDTNIQTTNANPSPMLINLPGQSGSVTQLSAGANYSLALTSTGQLYSFGSNFYGELGRSEHAGFGNANPTPTPVSLPAASGQITQISAGLWHALALTSSGQLYAFGRNQAGQLGSTINNDTYNANPTPTLVSLPGESGPVVEIAAGGEHSLALTASGRLYAFGSNLYGQLGSATNSGTNKANSAPVLVPLPAASGGVVHIAAGGGYSLALTSSGQLYAFGENGYGQLGNLASDDPNPTPTQVGMWATVDTVAASSWGDHLLVVTAVLQVANGSLPNASVGVPYSARATGEGGSAPYSWEAHGLPAGLSINHGNGVIEGTPQDEGVAHVTLSVTDKFGIIARSRPIVLNVERAKKAKKLVLSNLRQSNRRWQGPSKFAGIKSSTRKVERKRVPRGTAFTFRLNMRAHVTLVFKRRIAGRFRHIAVSGVGGFRGGNQVRFNGRISRRKMLDPGRYRMTATAQRGGLRSKSKSISFTIVR